MTANGDVTGENVDGIYAYNFFSGTNLTVTTAEGSVIDGNNFGIRARNFGTGELTVTANGDVTGENVDGIYAYNFFGGTNLTVTTGDGSVIDGENYGVRTRNYGTGALSLTANGDVTGLTMTASPPYNFSSGNGLTVTTGEDSAIDGNELRHPRPERRHGAPEQ